MYNTLMDIWNYLQTLNKPIVLYGMGNGADRVISVCEKYGIKISGVFSSDGFVRTKYFHGMPVTSYEAAKKNFGDMAVLLCFGTSRIDVIDNIKRIAAECELYAPEVPVCGDTVFCTEYYEAHKAEFDCAYRLLADEQSRRVFGNVLKYRQTGDINYLFACETDEDEPYGTFLHLSEDETFLDLGAYRGDTVLAFAGRAKKFRDIIAVEPDKSSYKKLCTATAHIENVRNINAFVGNGKDTVAFSMNGSRGAGTPGNRCDIDVISVDSLSVSPTFIKMDIEGSEAAALAGAAETVRRMRPKMQIAAYHRTEDLFEIPKAVREIRNDYSIYLRRNPCLPAWDLNYYFV